MAMRREVVIAVVVLVPCMILPAIAIAEPGLRAISVSAPAGGEQTYTVSIQVLMLMTVLTLLPAALMMMSAFTRIIVVLAILRQALGTAQTPSNQVLLGLALFLTFFVMAPVLEQVNADALGPYIQEEITAQEAVQRASLPVREFMLNQTREADVALFADIAGSEPVATPEQLPFSLLMPAFVTSELKTAFQIGFLVFIPFLIIDLVIASVLMSMGMMMLSPLVISFPFKIMLFVLVDGWALIVGTLAASFYV